MNTLTPFANDATTSGPDGATALRTLQQLTERQAEVAYVLRQQRQALIHWEHQLMRQNIRVLLQRARIDWGLAPGLLPRPLPSVPEAAPWAASLFPQAHRVICRSGCENDGDHWLDGERCARTGQLCDRP